MKCHSKRNKWRCSGLDKTKPRSIIINILLSFFYLINQIPKTNRQIQNNFHWPTCSDIIFKLPVQLSRTILEFHATTQWGLLDLAPPTSMRSVGLHRVPQVVALSALLSGVCSLCLFPAQLLGRITSSQLLAPLWNELPLALHLLPGVHSDCFYSKLETVLFSHAGIGSASE